MSTNPKTLQELQDRIHSGLEIPDADLDVLFGNPPVVEAPPAITPAPPAQPASQGQQTYGAAAPQNTDVVNTPPVGQPEEILNILPGKFKDPKDVAGSVRKAVQSYEHMESMYTRQTNELEQLRKTVNELTSRMTGPGQQTPGSFQSQGTPGQSNVQPQQAPAQTTPNQRPLGNPEPNLDDITPESEIEFLDRPRSESRKEARRQALDVLMNEGRALINQSIYGYDTYKTREQRINEFKATHSDFDNFRSEMFEVIKENPYMDTDPGYLPTIYEKAKERAGQKLSGGRPPEQTAQTTPPVDLDRMKAEWISEARNQILDEARKRRAAGGLAGGGGANPQTPGQRATPQPTERQLSPEDRLFEDIRNSGSNKDPLSAL